VLNQTRFVADETRARVLAAVEELGYQPDAAAQSLRSKRRRIVGLLITNPHNRSFASLIDGLDDVLAPAGYSIIVSATRGDPERELACIRMLREQVVDGLVVAGSAGGKEAYLRRLHDSGLPIVYVNRFDAKLPTDHVTLDYVDAGRKIAGHLIDLGHRRFALLGVGPIDPTDHPFLVGWYEVLQAVGIAADWTASFGGVSREEVGYRLAREALASHNRPSALVALNSPIAVGALLACQELGLAVPRDLSIAVLNDVPWAQVSEPRLTAVPNSWPEFGRVAARFLLDRMLGRYAGEPRLETFPADLVVRGSTGVALGAPLGEAEAPPDSAALKGAAG
jgi:LacI family transcriptional regulator